MKYWVKIVTGFRADQEFSIPAEEAHKAYYIFLHPEARTIFSTGVALKGDQIQRIVPDYIRTMGWNPAHQLKTEDWAEIGSSGVERHSKRFLYVAQEIAKNGDMSDLGKMIPELIETKYPELGKDSALKIGSTNHIKSLLPPRE